MFSVIDARSVRDEDDPEKLTLTRNRIQRAEVVALLERARIPQRGTVRGLRDRVARALSILREQQNR